MSWSIAPGIRVASVGLFVLLVRSPALVAHESYHDPQLDGQGFCASCHPGFAGGPNSPLHALHTKGSDPMTNNCSLCHTGNKRDNPLLMWSDDDGLGCMGCHGRDYGETIWNDYRGLPTAGKPKASGFGLRRLHTNAGVFYCNGCHDPIPPGGLVFGEAVAPPYYARSDVSLGGAPMAPCTNEDTLNDADGLGLDNDGDSRVDGQDPDCQPPESSILLSTWLLYWDAVAIGGSEELTVEIHNRGQADLVITQIAPCAGTSAEFSVVQPQPTSVPPFEWRLLTVSYAPIDLGVDDGCLEIHSNDPDEPVTLLQLSGQGFLSPSPEIELAPPALDFGSVSVGGAIRLETLVSNHGQQELLVTPGLCAGTSGEYTWDPAGVLAVPPFESRALGVTFSPVDAGLEAGCLDLLTNDPDEPVVSLGLDGTGVAGALLDLDITRFDVTRRTNLSKQKPISIRLDVENTGAVNGARTATVTGMQGSVQVYLESLLVSDPPGGGGTSWGFPSHVATATGDLLWTVTVADDDPDVDQATALTEVNP